MVKCASCKKLRHKSMVFIKDIDGAYGYQYAVCTVCLDMGADYWRHKILFEKD